MLRYEIVVASPADLVLFDGLPQLAPVLETLGTGALLIGGLASAAWLSARPVGLPVRATRDVDLGIDRVAIGIRKNQARMRPLLGAHGFGAGFGGEEFRFSCTTEHGPFVVDLLLPSGASRSEPPEIEPGIPTLAAPGLRYAINRGAVPLELVLMADETRHFDLFSIALDAAFVMKAALAGSGLRTRPDKRVADTADAIMLAAACAADDEAMAALVANRRNSTAKKATRWIAESFGSERAAAARRVADYVGDVASAEWAVAAARRFAARLEAATAS